MKINLASTRLAFYLLLSLAALIILSAIIPQQGLAEQQVIDWQHLLGRHYVVIETLRLDRIYTSPLFLGVMFLLAVNLVAGNVARIRRLPGIRSLQGRMRVLGSVLFHLALTVVIIGASLNHLYRYRVVFTLTEGQTANDVPGGYFRDLSGPLCRDAFGTYAVRLERVHDAWPVGRGTTEAAEITVSTERDEAETRGLVRANYPLRKSGIEFHLGPVLGYSPELSVTAGDEKVFRSFVRLSRRETENNAIVDADFVMLADNATRIDMLVEPGPESGRTRVTVQHADQEVYSGYPGPSGAMLADGTTVAVPRMRRWCYVEAIRNPFMDVVFAGFWGALGSLVLTAIPRVIPARRKVS